MGKLQNQISLINIEIPRTIIFFLILILKSLTSMANENYLKFLEESNYRCRTQPIEAEISPNGPNILDRLAKILYIHCKK